MPKLIKSSKNEKKKKSKTMSVSLTKVAKKHKRPDWDEYFLHLSREVARRATCDRGQCGCVIVKEKRIMTTGYVGAPAGIAHCDDVGHQLRKTVREDGVISEHCVRTSHAEQNAICQAAKFGISLDGSTLYAKFEPCYVCAKLIINVGIKRVVCEKRYKAGDDTRKLFKEARIKFEVLSNEVEKY